ncbi:MAG: UDP-N-acetylmuramate dehydrogenase [Solirubrobacteraceae bacterium]
MIEHRSLSDLTTLRLGGPPATLVVAEDQDALIEASTAAQDEGAPLLVVGGGSNLVVADDGFPGTVLVVDVGGVARACQSDGRVLLDVAAGEVWDDLVDACVVDGLAGIEALAGIPGTVGATPIQNVGAYGQQVAETIVGIRAYDSRTRKIVSLSSGDCGFAYRESVFQADPGRFLILGVRFMLWQARTSGPLGSPEVLDCLGLRAGATAPIAEVRDAVIGLRAAKGMVLDANDHDTWSVGSFFKNPVLAPGRFAQLCEVVAERHGLDNEMPYRVQLGGRVKVAAAWLIENAGFPKGYPLTENPEAGISLSTKHVMALTNRGEGTTRELLGLAQEITDGVHRVYGISMIPEPVLVGVGSGEEGPLVTTDSRTKASLVRQH